MASSSTSRFQLTSTQTALVFTVPPNQQPEINSLRSIHDKAFRKWEPHISVLYPFVEPDVLSSAIATLREALQTRHIGALTVNVDKVDVFRHRKNATVFLKPDSESGESICRLRGVFVKALGCHDRDGTHDGTFRPHLTAGQASLNGSAVEKLAEQLEKLVGLNWEGRTLSVLKREVSGDMRLVDELQLGNFEDATLCGDNVFPSDTGWRSCYSFKSEGDWNHEPKTSEAPASREVSPIEVSVSTYNLMADADPLLPPFKSRLRLIIQAISSAVTPSKSALRVLCLQEVNDEMLPLILAEPFIQTTFPFSTHNSLSLLPSHRNLVTLASSPFKQFSLQFAERHKTALIISLDGLLLEVANVHLTSGLTNEAVHAKKGQMHKLAEFLVHELNKVSKEVILAGDFNLTTSSLTLETASSRELITPETVRSVGSIVDPKIWTDTFNVSESNSTGLDQAGYEGEEGATFDRLTNPLAAMSHSLIINRPERYDRVLFHNGGKVHVKNFQVFGRPTEQGQCGSDHYGVCATLQTHEQDESDPGTNSLFLPNEIVVVEDSTDIHALIEPNLPDVADRQQQHQALELLRDTLTSSRSKVADLIFAPLGSYCMDTYFADSDVDVLVIGSVVPQIFFDFAISRLKALDSSGENGFKGVHFVNSLVSILELAIAGIKFDLQYCQAPELVERYHSTKLPPDLAKLVFDTKLVSALNPSSIRPLNTFRDTAFLLNSIPHLPSYQLAHRYLSLYLKRRGLYSAKFGYLGGIHLSLMLNRVVKLMAATSRRQSTPGSSNDSSFSPATVLRTFFTYYAGFDWAKENITDPTLDEHQNLSRSLRDSVFIYSIHTPTARPNVASSCTMLTAQTLTYEFNLANEKLQHGDWQWCLRPREATICDFLTAFGAFVRVQVDVWDVSEIGEDKVREMLGSLESKFPRLSVALGRVSGLDGRIWPARLFTRKDEAEMKVTKEDKEQQFKGYYLLGISGRDEDLDDQRKKLFTGKVITAVREFERSVKESKDLEGGNIWISTEVVPKRKIMAMDLVEDRRDWGRIDDSHPIETIQTGLDEIHLDSNTPTTGTVSNIKSQQRSTSKSLRPAQDIISRIHWDPALSADDFMIGYEDRFVGVKETDLTRWKSEQTDEEFIPMHRIVWIRRKGEGDGEKVWDRRRKVDLIFGSGVTGGKTERG